jgi:uncharacterized membrane protein YeaQ/YmgE (transglycosylase-associated protein family)
MGSHLLSALIIGLLAGWLANAMNNGRGGIVGNLIIGLLGSVVGDYVAGLVGLSVIGFWPSLVVSTLGAMLLLLVFSLFHRIAS